MNPTTVPKEKKNRGGLFKGCLAAAGIFVVLTVIIAVIVGPADSASDATGQAALKVGQKRRSAQFADSSLKFLRSTSVAALRAMPESQFTRQFEFLDRYTRAVGPERERLDSVRSRYAAIQARTKAAAAPPPAKSPEAKAPPKGQLSCYEEPGTRVTTCIDENNVTVNGAIRSSPVYSGGPNGVSKTPYLFLTDCARGVSTLQDREGVNFAGDFSSATEAASSLSRWTCEARHPRKDPTLKQF